MPPEIFSGSPLWLPSFCVAFSRVLETTISSGTQAGFVWLPPLRFRFPFANLLTPTINRGQYFKLANDWLAEQPLDRARDKAFLSILAL